MTQVWQCSFKIKIYCQLFMELPWFCFSPCSLIFLFTLLNTVEEIDRSGVSGPLKQRDINAYGENILFIEPTGLPGFK